MLKSVIIKMEHCINDDYIVKYFQREDGTVKGAALASRIVNAHSEIATYMQNRFSFTQDYKEVYYLLYHGLKERPKCPVCGKEVPFAKFNIGYRKYCSLDCQRSEKGKQIKKDCQKQTCLHKYGVSSVLQLEDVRKKSEETSLRKYGCKRPSQSEIVKQHTRENNLKKYGSVTHMSSQGVKDKIKQTCIERYGVDNVFKCDDIKKKVEYTCIERYGTVNVQQNSEIRKKTQDTCIERYGSVSPLLNEGVKEKTLYTLLQKYGVYNAMQSDEVKQRAKQTCLTRYGYESYSQTEEYKERYQRTCLERYGVTNTLLLDVCKERSLNTIHEKYGVDYAFCDKDIQKRALEASLQSSTSKSKAEDAIYEELCCIYGKGNIIRQYKSNVYPFHCDFYIQSEDLYIEYQGSWTHGNMPYIEGDTACVQQLQQWEEKAVNSEYYKDAIETWTYRDVIKRETARKYKLNYIEIW